MSAEPEERYVNLTCFKCHSEQQESSLVVSTICKSCGQYLKIEDGAVVIQKSYETRFASKDRPPIIHERKATPPPRIVENEGRLDSFFKKIFAKKPDWRVVDCYHCGDIFKVLEEAQSTQCPSCGGYVSLKNFEVRSQWRSQIQTRGNVVIEREGILIGFSVECQNLVINGKFSAPAKCSGVLTIRSDMKITGDLTCSEFRVEKGAKIEVQGEVKTSSVYIDGNVKAKILCTGTITLEKKAHLQGMARATAIVTKAGAKHTGAMQIVKK